MRRYYVQCVVFICLVVPGMLGLIQGIVQDALLGDLVDLQRPQALSSVALAAAGPKIDAFFEEQLAYASQAALLWGRGADLGQAAPNLKPRRPLPARRLTPWVPNRR